MNQMFCFQCQQTARNIGCTVQGVCGKNEKVANLQDKLLGKAAALAHVLKDCKDYDYEAEKLIIDSLFITITNVNFSYEDIQMWCDKVDSHRNRLRANSCGSFIYELDMNGIWQDSEDTRSLKSLVIFGLKGMAAYAHHAAVLGYVSREVNGFFIKALSDMYVPLTVQELLDLVMQTGHVNLKCMELLDKANTKTYGDPVPVRVSSNIEKGPFIVVTGHDLHDLYLLLKQTENKGINIYTHGEMLPCHAYPELKKFKHLKGNFGTAWQNQQKEFANLPAPVLFTTNCIMPVKDSYADRIFTTSLVGYDNMTHIGSDKDFSAVIEKAIVLGGYTQDTHMTGINGGDTLTTGFGHHTVLSAAGDIIDAVKNGAIKHFFLVGGCDGAAVGRNYYTDFVKQTPQDSIVLTLACGKFRFNDLDLGKIGAFPRIMDMGQCNDAYSAIKVASALADAFGCDVNELPLTLVLSWYEQKAVCILLTLLAIGMKNFYLGPTLPAFVSPNILKTLVENWNIKLISTAENDLKQILG